MRADLHLHTVCSDGLLPPAEIARRAKEAGLSLFAVTDHDTLAGNEEAERAARTLGVGYVRGIEISAYLGATKVHILGYGCREGEAYSAFLRARTEGAKERAEDIVRRANQYFSLDVTLAEVENHHLRKEAPLHSMHVVRTFAARLHADVGELYRTAFAPGCPAFSDLFRPTPSEALSCIRAMGGLAVIAHPAQILVLPAEVSERFHLCTAAEKEEAKKFYAPARNALMERLVGEGAEGIECFHSTHTAEETEEFLAFAQARGLLVTGGSDFHSDGAGRTIGLPAFEPSGRLLCALRSRGSE